MLDPRPAPAPRQARSGLELADILRAHGEAYRLAHVLAPAERKAFDAILACRTARLGGHLDVCDACGHAAPSYNSCRNRHCPKCQSLRQARWIEARKERLLPVHYFHVVFTMPAQLRGLARRNPVALYDLLFAAASRTLLALGADPARLGGTLGITAVLHTWTRALALHPHLHCIVTGGGLAPGGAAWVSARRKHLFPVRVLSRLYRGKFLAALSDAYAAGELDLSGSAAPLADPAAFGRLKDTLYRTEWVVYAKRPFGGAEQVFSYLGRYTHRVGISNQRLRALDAGGVHFATKSGQAITLAPAEFIRRFLLHILPAHFVKIRHYGVLAAGNVHTKLAAARRLLAADLDAPAGPDPAPATAPPDPAPTRPTWQRLLLALTGLDVTVCARCATGRMLRFPLPPSRPSDTS